LREFKQGDEVVYRAKRLTVWARIGRQYLCRDGDVGVLAHPEELTRLDLLAPDKSLSVSFGQRTAKIVHPREAKVQ